MLIGAGSTSTGVGGIGYHSCGCICRDLDIPASKEACSDV